MNDLKTPETTKKPLPASAEDIALIRSMMDAGRRRAGIDGSHMIIWGTVLMIAFMAQYGAIVGWIPPTILGVWIPATVIGTALSFYVGNKEIKTNEGCNNIALSGYTAAWGMTGISAMVYFGTAIVSDTINPGAVSSFDPKGITLVTSAVFGGAYFVIARITGIKNLYYAAIGWWMILSYTTQLETFTGEMLPVLSLASLFLILVPGFLMRKAGQNSLNGLEE